MEIVYIALLTLVTGVISTIAGFGISTIMVPVLLFFFPVVETLFLVGIIHWFGNIWKLVLFKEGIRKDFIFIFGVPGAIAAFIGARLVFTLSEVLLVQIIGLFLIVYSVFLLINPSFKIRANKQVTFAAGALSGFLAGLLGVGGAVRSAFLAAFNLPKAVFIASNGLLGFAIDSSRLFGYFINGARLENFTFWGVLVFVAASFLGRRLRRK